jgi:cell division protein FtsB
VLENLTRNIERNRELLESLKRKRINLDRSIENLEHKIKNQQYALERATTKD